MRLFVAVNFNDDVRRAIAGAIQRFPVNNPPWRWARPETWHVTLKFLGEVSDDDVAPIGDCLEDVAAVSRRFELSLGEPGGFPNLSRPRVLFYRVVDGAGDLAELAARVDGALAGRLGVPTEDRPFRAHATVARIKTRLPGAVVAKIESAPRLENARQPVTSFELMHSVLGRGGARYTVVKQFALAGGP